MSKERKILSLIFGLSLLFVTACGKTAYNVSPNEETIQGPGNYYIKPKVDFLAVIDDTGSITNSLEAINQGLRSLLSTIIAQNWDVHFAQVPLTKYRAITQVLATDSSSVNSSVYRASNNYTGYLTQADVSTGSQGSEPGLKNILDVLKNNATQTGWGRADSKWKVMFFGNGQDTSYVNMCKRPYDGLTLPCDQMSPAPAQCTPTATDPTGGSSTCDSTYTSMSFFENAYRNLNANLQVYAMVGGEAVNNCLGASSYVGSRYMDIAGFTNGSSIDVCTKSMNDLFAQFSADLQAERRSYKQRYLFLKQEPDLSSLKITRYIDGSSSNTVIITSSNYQYLGYKTDYAVDYPSKLNMATGYALRLSDDAEIQGDDQVKISYLPKGSQNTVSE